MAVDTFQAFIAARAPVEVILGVDLHRIIE